MARLVSWFAVPIDRYEKLTAVDAAFKGEDYAKAASLRKELAEANEKTETEQAGKPGTQTATELGGLSYYLLFARQFDAALAASERGLALAGSSMVSVAIATNRAHALMFLGRAEEARSAYQEHRLQRTMGGAGLWEEEISNDFNEFEKHGLTHPQMAEIRRIFNEGS